MKTTTILFKNVPQDNGDLASFEVAGCLIAQNGSPTARRPEILIHLPKKFKGKVDGGWIDLEDHSYHITGTTVKVDSMIENKPTPWNRYAIAERII